MYGNCQFQELVGELTAMLTFEGFTAFVTRLFMGLQAELPIYYTKLQMSTKLCIKGESAGKMA